MHHLGISARLTARFVPVATQPSWLLAPVTDALRQQYVPKAKSLVKNGAGVKGRILAVRNPYGSAKEMAREDADVERWHPQRDAEIE